MSNRKSTPATPDSESDERVEIEGKIFRFTSEEGDVVEIPLRVRLKVLRSLTGRDLDAATMFEIVEKIAPGQADTLDELDVNEFQSMFLLWQQAYAAQAGASLGEASRSSR